MKLISSLAGLAYGVALCFMIDATIVNIKGDYVNTVSFFDFVPLITTTIIGVFLNVIPIGNLDNSGDESITTRNRVILVVTLFLLFASAMYPMSFLIIKNKNAPTGFWEWVKIFFNKQDSPKKIDTWLILSKIIAGWFGVFSFLLLFTDRLYSYRIKKLKSDPLNL